jgi:hypothetical protein
MVIMPPSILGQANTTFSQSSATSTIAQAYTIDCISISIPCLLPYPIDGAGKIKEVAKDLAEPVGGLFQGNPIPPLYTCVQVQQIIKSSYEYHEIDIPTAYGKHCLEK